MSLNYWLRLILVKDKVVRSSQTASLFSCKCFLPSLLKWGDLGDPGPGAGGRGQASQLEAAQEGQEGDAGRAGRAKWCHHRPAGHLATPCPRSNFPETGSAEPTVWWRDAWDGSPSQPGDGVLVRLPPGVGSATGHEHSGHEVARFPGRPWALPEGTVWFQTVGVRVFLCLATAHSEALLDNLKHRLAFFLRRLHTEGPSPYQCTDTWHGF